MAGAALPILVNEDAIVVAPSSLSQRRLWMLDRLYGQAAAYNVPSAHRLTGPLDVAGLQRAVDVLVQRHDALRTSLRLEGDDVVQVILPQLSVPITFESLKHLPESSRFSAACEASRIEAALPFNLERAPLFRARLFRLNERDHVLSFCFHHAIFDGWSEAVFMNQLTTLYDAHAHGRETLLAPAPVHYRDFAVSQRELAKGPEAVAALEYWRHRLTGAPAKLNLPLDTPRPGRSAHQGAQESLLVSKALTDALHGVSRKHDATLFMTLLSAYSVVLHRYSGDPEVMVGTVLAGRNRAELDNVIGYFVGTVALRVSVGHGLTFLQLLDQIKHTSLDAHAHQDVPFEKVVEALHPQRTTGQMPFFQTIFVLQGADTGRRTAGGVRFEQVAIHNGTSKCDLILSVGPARDGRDGLCCSLEYDTELFARETAARLLASYVSVLTAIAADPSQAIASLPIVGAEDLARLAAWTDAPSQYARASTIHREFENTAARTPAAIAVTAGSRSLTYAQLDARANQLAARLRREGVQKGDLVGVCLERSIEAIVSQLAVLKAGGAYVPLDPAYPKLRLDAMVQDAGARVVLSHTAAADLFPRGVATVIFVDEDAVAIAQESTATASDDGGSNDLAYVMYTSGSTGRSNGVRIPHRGVLRLALGGDYLDWNKTTTFLQMAPLSFDAATFEIWSSLLRGQRLVIFPDRVPTVAKLAQVLAAEGIDCLWLPSALFNLVIDEHPDCLASVSQLVVGGEALSVPHVRQAQARLPSTQLVNGYGPTECTTFACCHSIPVLADGAVSSIPIGRPIAGTSCLVLDDRRQPVPIGVVGELYVGGDGVALGYHNRPSLTVQRFVPDPTGRSAQSWYRTGDRARWTMEGVLEFHGRLDSQLKVRGFRVEPGEIEAVCRGCPGVRDASVVIDSTRSARLVAFVVSEPGSSITSEDLRRRLGDQLPAHLIPAEFVMLDALPLTPNGKVDRIALSSRHCEAGRDSRAVASAPLNATEHALSRIWRSLLEVDAVGIHDDFFLLGGHSLLAMRMFTELQATFGRDLPFSTLLGHPTIAALARLLDGPAQIAARSLSLVPLKDQGTRPPLFLIHGIGNEVWSFRDLAHHVHAAQPVYGLVHCGQTAGSRSVQDRVKAYLPDLEALLPSGPFALGAHCLGAVMAFEIARQLRARGRRDCLLVVFDYFLEDAPAGPLAVAANAVTWVADDLLRTPLGHNLGRARSRLRLLGTGARHAVGHRPEQPDVRDVLGMWRYPDHEVERLQHDMEAMRAYRFGPYDGSIHVFRARTRALGNRHPVGDMGWGRVSAGGLTVETVPGSHDTMLRPPFVRTLANRLDSALRRAFDTAGPRTQAGAR